MPYVLGIDVGTSRTVASVSRQDGPTWGDAEICRLGDETPGAASVVYFAPDGTVIVGDAAEAHARHDPAHAARDFIRRVGDEVPLLVRGQPCTAADLAAVLITWVADQVTAAEGTRPGHIVVTHPPGWGNYRRQLLHRALRQNNLPDVTLLPEAVAIGECHAATGNVPVGHAIAVYDLGAAGLTTAVVRRSPHGTFELLTWADSVEPDGGAYFDDLVYERLGADIDPADPHAWTTMSRMRLECAAAKEALSTSAETVVRGIRLTRAEFEADIKPAVHANVDVLLRTIRSAPVTDSELTAAVLTGGCARIPLVVDMVTGQVRCPVVVPPDPELTIAKGATLAAQRLVPAAGVPAPVNPDEPDEEPPPRPSIEINPLDLPAPRSVMRTITNMKPSILGGAGAVVVMAGVLLTIMLRPEPPAQQAPPASGPATSAATPSHAGSKSTITAPTQQTGKDGH